MVKDPTPRQRSLTGRELWSKDHFRHVEDLYKPLALLLVREANLIKALADAQIETPLRHVDTDRDPPTPESIAALEAVVAFHSLVAAPPVPLVVYNTAASLAFKSLSPEERQRYHDTSEAQKAASAAAKLAAKAENKRKKQNPASEREPISNSVLKQYVQLQARYVHLISSIVI